MYTKEESELFLKSSVIFRVELCWMRINRSHKMSQDETVRIVAYAYNTLQWKHLQVKLNEN